jgi:eukaryotic-like serine/threonine-protein kinase
VSSPFPERQLGEYELVREVGRGAMGIVFEAIHRPSGRQVALKLLVFPPLIPDEEREGLIARFAREARALASVRHPHVVSVHDVGIVDGPPFMAMEYLVGMNAREWLHRHGPMPPGDLVRIGCQLCSALEAVHAAGIVHRDVKPDNVVLTEDGSVRLTDFGIARMEVEASLTRTGGLIGSPAYMAPEQILGGTVDARSDLFSAGVTLYQLLTGELPFQGTQLMEIAHRVAYDPPRPPVGAPPALAAVILRALDKDPDRRFAPADELGSALEEAAASDPGAQAMGVAAATPITVLDTPSPVSPPLGTPTLHRPQPSVSSSVIGHCEQHPGRAAAASCSECGTPLCGACVRFRLGRAWCEEHSTGRARPLWMTRLEVLWVGLLFALLMLSLYPLRW